MVLCFQQRSRFVRQKKQFFFNWSAGEKLILDRVDLARNHFHWLQVSFFPGQANALRRRCFGVAFDTRPYARILADIGEFVKRQSAIDNRPSAIIRIAAPPSGPLLWRGARARNTRPWSR